MPEDTDFWRHVKEVAQGVVTDYLSRPTGMPPGVHSGITFDRYGRALTARGIGLSAIARLPSGAADLTMQSGSITVVNYGSVIYDPGSAIVTGTAWHYTVPREAGVRVDAMVNIKHRYWLEDDYAALYLYKNGAHVQAFDWQDGWTPVGGGSILATPLLHGNVTDYCAAGDQLSIRFECSLNVGTAVTLDSSDEMCVSFELI